MTDKPTPEQIQRACDSLNTASGIPNNYNPRHYGVNPDFTALADTIAKLDAMQAERDKARADLGEISRLLDQPMVNSARAIAAPYRVETDPLVEALVAANARLCDSEEGYAPILRAELAKRGLEIGRSA